MRVLWHTVLLAQAILNARNGCVLWHTVLPAQAILNARNGRELSAEQKTEGLEQRTDE